jgi:hypothetical protein
MVDALVKTIDRILAAYRESSGSALRIHDISLPKISLAVEFWLPADICQPLPRLASPMCPTQHSGYGEKSKCGGLGDWSGGEFDGIQEKPPAAR